MPRGRDLTITLPEQETNRLRALLQTLPPVPDNPDAGSQYPMVLYNEKFVEAQRKWKHDTTPEGKKRADEEMKLAMHIVHDPDEEEEFLADGWKHNPADFLAPEHDPRVPVGREARREQERKQMTVEEEVIRLRMRLAELTGQRIDEPVSKQVTAATKTERVRTRTAARKKKAAPNSSAEAAV